MSRWTRFKLMYLNWCIDRLENRIQYELDNHNHRVATASLTRPAADSLKGGCDTTGG